NDGRRRKVPCIMRGTAMSDETYGPERAERLAALLRELAARIMALDQEGRLLEHAAEMQKLLGTVRSELFHYEVRVTYDSPEVAESRRIVEEAERQLEELRFDEHEDDEDEGSASIGCWRRCCCAGWRGAGAAPRRSGP